MSDDFVKTFASDETFGALYAAEQFLTEHGFSVGSNQRGAPTGVMFGDFCISKWRNLDQSERGDLHGLIDAGDHRNGPVIIRIFAHAPEAARASFSKAGE